MLSRTALVLSIGLLSSAARVSPQTTRDIEMETLLATVLSVDQHQRDRLSEVVFDAEYVEGQDKDNGDFEEKKRLVKKIFLIFRPDTIEFRQEFIEYYKDGERQSEEELRKEAEKRESDKAKRKMGDISFPIMNPLREAHRQEYELTYRGVTETEIDGYLCHHIRAIARVEEEGRISADYYFETTTFHLVRVEFRPAKLVSKALFKLKDLNMTIWYQPTAEGIWLPVQFDISGSGRAALLFGVGFSGTEHYRNPRVTLKTGDNP